KHCPPCRLEADAVVRVDRPRVRCPLGEPSHPLGRLLQPRRLELAGLDRLENRGPRLPVPPLAVDGERRYRKTRAAILEAVESGELQTARLEEAAERVRRLAEWASHARPVDADDGVGLEAARRAVL